jgi:hypothetical protein
MDRRGFLQSAAAAALTATADRLAKAFATATQKMIGIQIGAVFFANEGTERVLDELQQDALINTPFLATFTYGRGIAGRQLTGQPLPDHGKLT